MRHDRHNQIRLRSPPVSPEQAHIMKPHRSYTPTHGRHDAGCRRRPAIAKGPVIPFRARSAGCFANQVYRLKQVIQMTNPNSDGQPPPRIPSERARAALRCPPPESKYTISTRFIAPDGSRPALTSVACSAGHKRTRTRGTTAEFSEHGADHVE